MINLFLFIFIVLFFQSCATTPFERYSNTLNYAKNNQWECKIIETDKFNLNSCIPKNLKIKENLIVFIEGDGFSWVTKNQSSTNPTPFNPLLLKIAINLNKENSVYLSRPCQNTFDENFKNCSKEYWTSKIYSDEIINSMNSAINKIKLKHKAENIILVGYSGGGVISLILASLRNDIKEVITIASNIELEKWASYHKISKINSINPGKLHTLSKIKQNHFVGGKDNIVPPFIVNEYKNNFKEKNNINIITIDDFTHNCCWENTSTYWYFLK